MIRQNYKVNRKVKEAVDTNQINYRASPNDPISVIKRVYVYITDKKGNIIPEVTITIDDVDIKTGYNGLLVSNFPNEEKTITASKDGYKSATATVILNAEIQTHNFYLVLTTDDDESTVISTDDTISQEDDISDNLVLFELENGDTLVEWSGFNSIDDGVYTGHGSYIQRGWSNAGLWQLDFDVKYNRNGDYHYFYVGTMPFCSEEINPYSDSKLNDYAFVTWEKSVRPYGLDSICLEGPENYKYNNAEEYHHTTIKKISDTKIEYYFDNQKWVFSIAKLPNLETLHFGTRDNESSRKGGTTISYKNIKVVSLTEKQTSSEPETQENENSIFLSPQSSFKNTIDPSQFKFKVYWDDNDDAQSLRPITISIFHVQYKETTIDNWNLAYTRDWEQVADFSEFWEQVNDSNFVITCNLNNESYIVKESGFTEDGYAAILSLKE